VITVASREPPGISQGPRRNLPLSPVNPYSMKLIAIHFALTYSTPAGDD